jgi:hypothetical protein
MQAGVVRPSDSPWRSNVVLVKKPSSSNEFRDNTKASYQTGFKTNYVIIPNPI